MTSRLSTRFAVAALVLTGGLVLANCNRPAPEPQPAPVAMPVVVAEPVARPARPVVARTTAVVLVTPMLADKAKVLLSQGTDVDAALRGFKTPQQFLAVAYASKNLAVPFVLLKDKVLTRQMTLASAIEATSKYNVNGTLEAQRAESEARADLARKSGPQ